MFEYIASLIYLKLTIFLIEMLIGNIKAAAGLAPSPRAGELGIFGRAFPASAAAPPGLGVHFRPGTEYFSLAPVYSGALPRPTE